MRLHPWATRGTTTAGLNTPNVGGDHLAGHLAQHGTAAREVGRGSGNAAPSSSPGLGPEAERPRTPSWHSGAKYTWAGERLDRPDASARARLDTDSSAVVMVPRSVRRGDGDCAAPRARSSNHSPPSRRARRDGRLRCCAMTGPAILAKITALPGKRDELVAALQAMLDHVENETGTLVYILHTDTGNDDVVWFYERYDVAGGAPGPQHQRRDEGRRGRASRPRRRPPGADHPRRRRRQGTLTGE